MGKKIKKPFKETLFGKILGKAKDVVLDTPAIIGDIATGNVLGAISKASSALSNSPNKEDRKLVNELTLKMKEIQLEFDRIELEELKTQEENITKRWEADMNSDSKLSKNARPLALFWALSTITILLIISWAGVKTPEQVLALFGGVVTSIVGGYFILRTVEKRNSKKYK